MPTGDPNPPVFKCPFAGALQFQPIPMLKTTQVAPYNQSEINELRSAKEKAETELDKIKAKLYTIFEYGNINLAEKYKKDGVKFHVFWNVFDALQSFADYQECESGHDTLSKE